MTPCIEHQQKGIMLGYGMTYWRGGQISLHRKAYCMANDLTPEAIKGKVIRHSCDNARCINPEHLLVGTHQDNMDDRNERGRTACLKGDEHPRCRKLTAPDVLHIRERRASGESATSIAEDYGISQSYVSQISLRKSWTHI